jgi:hypothetical protein
MAEVSALAAPMVSGWASKGQTWGTRRRWRFRGVGGGSEGAEWVDIWRVWLSRGSRGVKFYVDGSASDPNSVLLRRHGVADDFIWLENMPAIFEACRCDLKNEADPKPLLGSLWGTVSKSLVGTRYGHTD